MNLKISKIKDVKTPERAHETDAGIDFFIPNDFESVTLVNGQNIKIPMGIRCKFPHGYKLQFVEKSGVASKMGLLLGAKLIDSDYAGELILNLNKVTGDSVELHAGMKIVQATLEKVELSPVEVISDVELSELHEESKRGSGGFGSTGV